MRASAWSFCSRPAISYIIIEDEPYYVYNYTKGFAAFNKNWSLGDMNYTCAWDWNFKDVVYNG